MKVYVTNTITVRCRPYLMSMSPFSLIEYADILASLQKSMEVSYTVELELIDDYTMSGYSKQFHDVFAPTNILSFESEEESPAMLLLSLETAKRESILYSQEYPPYILHLITHGFVHSSGFDHGVELERHCARCYYALLSFL